jgi:hypothetical protein
MWKARGAFGALLLRRYSMAILGALAILLGLGSAFAQQRYDDPDTAEGWAWPQIQLSEMPDFNERCQTPELDPKKENDARWHDDCRKLSARFLEDLLTRAPWRDAIPFAGIQIKGARIVGDVDLENAKLIRSISILASRIEGAINLIRARTDSLIWLEGSLMNGSFDASGLHSESDLLLHNGSIFKSGITLSDAKIDGHVGLTGATFESKLEASQLHIGGSLLMNSDNQNKASFKEVDLTGTKVAGQVNMFGASIAGPLNAVLLKVGGNLLAASSGEFKTRFQIVNLVSAEIAGNVSLIGADFDGALNAGLLRVGGILAMNSNDQNKTSFKEVDLTNVKVAGFVIMGGAGFDGLLDASFLQVGGDLSMASSPARKTRFEKNVNLSGAKVAGSFAMTGASFEGKLEASQLQIGGSLLMNSDNQNKASFKEVNLTGTKVAGEVNLFGASIDGPLNAVLLKVGGNLLAPSIGEVKTRYQLVNLVGAEIAGNVNLIGAGFDGALNAGLLQVGGSLAMNSNDQNRASFKEVNLTGAKVAGFVSMVGATFEGRLNADSLKVGGEFLMRHACHADQGFMALAQFGGNLDLRGASFTDLDLSGASVAGDLRLDGQQSATCFKSSGTPDVLNLRNAKVGNLMVANDALTASRRLHLDGFSFAHVGGFEGDTGSGLRVRSMKWWDNWARLDPDYSPTPYAQLAAAFTNSGDRDAANDIRYFDRERAREVACKENWLRGSCPLQTALGWVAGYGIGSHTFVVLPWVLGFWLAGAALLWWTVPAAKHNGSIWCCCASLAQLLPVIAINKELTAFFDDPERTRLRGWQVFVFSALRVVGLALGAILLVAVSGLTHSS